MDRLVPEALYANRQEYKVEDVWSRAAKNIKRIDPDGSKSYALIRTTHWKYGGRSDRVR